MTGYISKKMLGAARLPDTPSARAYLKKVLEDDDTQVYKKPWVGLTDEDILKWRSKYKFSRELLKEVESLLKEKNNGTTS